MAKRKLSVQQKRHVMNNITARSIVVILVKAANETNRGRIPGFLAIPSAEKELSLAAVTMQASFLETWMNFVDTHWKLSLPTKKPAVKHGAKLQQAGLEYKLEAMLAMAKKQLPGLKLSRKDRSTIITCVNSALQHVSICVRIRNKVAHGQPFAAMKNSGRFQQKLSKTIQQMTLQGLTDMVVGVSNFTDFCEIMLDPKPSVKRLDIKKRILSGALNIAIGP